MAVITHSFKYKPTTAPSGTEDRVLACSHTTDDCHCVINASGQIGYYVSGVFTQIGTATVSLNEQYAFIIEHDDSGNGCIYLNGQKIGCATNFPTTAINQIGNFKTELKPETGRKPKVGLKPRAVSNIYTRPCCGIIDEYARFNRALSASEVVDLSQSGTLSKVYTLADYKIALMADDGIIATTEKPRYKENWRSIWNADQRTSALPTAIASITVNGSYKSLATSANDAGIWTPTTNGTPAYDYYQAVESWRKMYFVSSGGGTGFLLTANLAGDTDISAMSPTLEARQSALMFAEDALRSAVMIKRQSTAELTAVANANAYTDELEDALREQTDHAIVFTTSTSDPSTSWTAEEKLIHKGDYWRVDASSAWKTWTGTTWGTVNDAQAQAAASAAASAASTAQTSANNAQEIANAKRRVFTTTPTTPYDVGDLWVAGSSGDIKRCIIARATGSYTASEWDIASKYTDDTTAKLKSRTYIQASAPSIGLNAGDYWLDSDDGYKPYVYKDRAWAVDQAMQTAINAGTAASNAQSSANAAQSTANAKTTLYGTLASAKLAAKTGDQFFYNSEIYVCTADLATSARRYTTKSYGNSATAPVQTAQTISGCVLTEPLNYGDTYFNTTTKKFYTYTTSWVEDTATSNAVIAYAPKYLGRYYQSHPGAPNIGDWWLVYGVASSPVTRGFWYNNNGTNTLVSTLGTEAQRKYKGSGLEDVLYASNNGYALTSGGVYDPVSVYGVSTMEFLAVNQAFIQTLMVQELTLKSTGKIKSENFVTGESGFQLQASDGSAEFNDVTMRGKVISQAALFTKDYEIPGLTVWQEDIADVSINMSTETASAIAAKLDALLNSSKAKQMFDYYGNDGTRSGKMYICILSSSNIANSIVIYNSNAFGVFTTHLGQYIMKYTDNSGVIKYVIGTDLSSEYGGFVGNYERLLLTYSGGSYTKYTHLVASNKLIIKTRVSAVETYGNMYVDGYVQSRCGIKLNRRGIGGYTNIQLKTRHDVYDLVNRIRNGNVDIGTAPVMAFYNIPTLWSDIAFLSLNSSTQAAIIWLTRSVPQTFNKDDLTPIDNTYIFI